MKIDEKMEKLLLGLRLPQVKDGMEDVPPHQLTCFNVECEKIKMHTSSCIHCVGDSHSKSGCLLSRYNKKARAYWLKMKVKRG